MTMAKTKRTPHWPLVSTNPRGLAARVAATRPSPHQFQLPRAIQLSLSIYKVYIQVYILSPYSLAINHSAEAIVDAVVK